MTKLARLATSAALIALIGGASIATAQPAAAPPAEASAGVSVAPLGYTMRTLPNGLTVYSMPDDSGTNVSVQVWYKVGSRDDPPGRSGFAHLFEHIMFKSTRNMPTETFDRLTEDVGGFNNASTANDYTDYYSEVPANHLERILWAEAERMGSLVIDQATFDSERDVVKEELRQRVLASPYGPLFYLHLSQTAYAVHPYGRPGIGSIADLDAATVDDVRAFHATYYRPDNAVVVVAGNFDPADLDRWVDAYFAPIARPNRPIPRVETVEPLATAPRDFRVFRANVPLPAVTVSYPQPPAASADTPALLLLDAIMSQGESSRLYQSLVQRSGTAAEIFTNAEYYQQPGQYTLAAIVSEGKTTEEALALIEAEIAALRDRPVTAAELDEAKNELVTARIRARESASGRASELAEAIVQYGDAGAADAQIAAIQRVTPADIQRVARTLLVDARRITIHYRSTDDRTEGVAGDTIVDAPTIRANPLTIAASDIAVTTLAPPEARIAPPTAGPPVTTAIPARAEQRLANGLRVIVVPSRGLPLVSAGLHIRSGDASDPAPRSGLAELTAELTIKGTAGRDASATAAAFESLGAQVSANTGADSSYIVVDGRSDRIDAALALVAEAARAPALVPEEVDRARQQALDGIEIAKSEPGTLASTAIARAVYGSSAYGNVQTTDSVGAVTRDDIAAFHASHWRPDNALLVIAGDISEADGMAMAQRHFGAWAKPATPLPAPPATTSFATAPRTIIVDLPGTGQAAVNFGLPGIARSDPDYFPMLLANDILGGGYSARLNMEIRIRRGLSYGAGSGLSARRMPGAIIASVQTRNDAAVEVVGLVSSAFTAMGSGLPTPTEFAARQAALIGDFGRDVGSVGGLAGRVSGVALLDLPLSALDSFTANVMAVTPADVARVGAARFNPAGADIVVAGDAASFAEPLIAAMTAVGRAAPERIAAEALDGDSEALVAGE